jgi:hypothetical protein
MIILNIIAAVIVLARGVFALNHMGPCTSLLVRATWLVLTVAAAAVLLACAQPTWQALLLHWVIAVLVCVIPRGLTLCHTGGES